MGVRIIEVLSQGALPSYNKEQVDTGHWQNAVLPDMRIVVANNIKGDAGEIAEELKRCEEVTLQIRRAEQILQTQAAVRTKMRMLAKLTSGLGGSQSSSPLSRSLSPAHPQAQTPPPQSAGPGQQGAPPQSAESSQQGAPPKSAESGQQGAPPQSAQSGEESAPPQSAPSNEQKASPQS